MISSWGTIVPLRPKKHEFARRGTMKPLRPNRASTNEWAQGPTNERSDMIPLITGDSPVIITLLASQYLLAQVCFVVTCVSSPSVGWHSSYQILDRDIVSLGLHSRS